MLKRHIDERVMSQAKGQSIGHTGDWVESQHKKHEQIIAARNKMNMTNRKLLVPEARGLSRASLKRKKKKGVAPMATEQAAADQLASGSSGGGGGGKRMRASEAATAAAKAAMGGGDMDMEMPSAGSDGAAAGKGKKKGKGKKGKAAAAAAAGGAGKGKKKGKSKSPFADLEDMNAITMRSWIEDQQKKTNRVQTDALNGRDHGSAMEAEAAEKAEEAQASAATLQRMAQAEGVEQRRQKKRREAEKRSARREEEERLRYGGGAADRDEEEEILSDSSVDMNDHDQDDDDDDDDSDDGGGGGGGGKGGKGGASSDWDGDGAKPRHLMSREEKALDRSVKQRSAALARNAERKAEEAAAAAAEEAKPPAQRAAEAAVVEAASAKAEEKAAAARKEAKAAKKAAKKAARPSLKAVHLGGGLVVQDLSLGEGERRIGDGDNPQILYTGTIAGSGKRFDRCTNPNKPFTFEVGAGEVIIGMNDGVKGMRLNQRRIVTIPPEMAYGRTVQKKIPQNSTLVFDITLQGFGV